MDRDVGDQAIDDQFVELWNNMASLWGISPTMARIHGMLYITGSALSMDDIMARLAISRGNAPAAACWRGCSCWG